MSLHCAVGFLLKGEKSFLLAKHGITNHHRENCMSNVNMSVYHLDSVQPLGDVTQSGVIGPISVLLSRHVGSEHTGDTCPQSRVPGSQISSADDAGTSGPI